MVSCSYCGKVIGAFRLLRDSEFCCDLHRRQYGERLDKALHEMASPEPAPTGVAGFRDEMPLQPGNRGSTLIPWLTTAVRNRIRTGNHWPLTLDTSQAMSATAAVCECAPIEFPRHSERWLPDAAPALALRVPGFAAELDPTPFPDLTSQSPARCQAWMPVPAPEPVAAFVRASTALATRADTPHFLRFASELDPTPCLDLAPYALPAYDNWVLIPAPEPVAAFVQASVAPTPVYAPRTLLFTAELEHEPPLDANLAACHLRMLGFAAAEDCGAPADAQGVEP